MNTIGRWRDLQKVYADMESDPHFAGLRSAGVRLVPGDGPGTVDAAVMLVGEAPGATENGAGKPFAGASGRMLDQLLDLAGLKRDKVFITHSVKYRPPNNRTPTPEEMAYGRDYLRREHSIIAPTLTVAIGLTAQMALRQMNATHGLIRPLGLSNMYVTSVYPPAFGLRYQKARDWIEIEWALLGEQIRKLLPALLEE